MALEVLVGYEIGLKNGNSNHAPMVVEALCAMGRPHAVMRGSPGIRKDCSRVPRPAIRSALGQRDRFADWAEFFGKEPRQAPWIEVLDRWTERLAPGFCAAATHGVIRVGHAARSLAVAETPLRKGELGDALASWAVTYQELPSSDRITDRPMAPRQAIVKAPFIAPHERRSLGNITASLGMLDNFPEFARVIGLIDASSTSKHCWRN